MIRTDETALICDLAETYHIYDYKRLPALLVAAFSVGLRDDSRIKMKLSGAKAPVDIMLLAAAVDRLSLLVWMQTKDGQKDRNRPKSILEGLTGEAKTISAFMSGEEYEMERARLLNPTERSPD